MQEADKLNSASLFLVRSYPFCFFCSVFLVWSNKQYKGYMLIELCTAKKSKLTIELETCMLVLLFASDNVVISLCLLKMVKSFFLLCKIYYSCSLPLICRLWNLEESLLACTFSGMLQSSNSSSLLFSFIIYFPCILLL